MLAGPLMLPWFCSDPARSHGHRSFMAGTCGGCLPGPPLEIVGKKLALGTNCGQGLGSVCLQQTLWGLHLDYSSLVFPDFSPWELAGIPPPLPHLPGEGAGSWMVQDLVMNRGTAWHGGVCAPVAIRCPACCCGLGTPGLGLAESVLTVDQNVLWESREPRTPCVKSSAWEFRPGIRDGYFCAQRPFFFFFFLASCFWRVEVSNL